MKPSVAAKYDDYTELSNSKFAGTYSGGERCTAFRIKQMNKKEAKLF